MPPFCSTATGPPTDSTDRRIAACSGATITSDREDRGQKGSESRKHPDAGTADGTLPLEPDNLEKGLPAGELDPLFEKHPFDDGDADVAEGEGGALVIDAPDGNADGEPDPADASGGASTEGLDFEAARVRLLRGGKARKETVWRRAKRLDAGERRQYTPEPMEIDVRQVAKLARIELTDEELRTLEGQLARVLDYIEQLKELDVSKVEPFTHPGDYGNVLREDRVLPSMNREQALGNAPDRSADWFAVPRVLDG